MASFTCPLDQQPNLLPTDKTAMLWRNLTPLPRPHVKPGPEAKTVLVIGGGVTGLITAWTLLDRGYRVTVLSKEWASYGKEQRLTSQIAGALWEYPPAVCGQHTDRISLQNSKRWSMTGYHVYAALAADPKVSKASGVRMMPSNFYFPVKVEDHPHELRKMREIMAAGVIGFRRGNELINEFSVDPVHGGVDAYGIMAPVIDTDAAMSWLMDLVRAKGGVFHTETIVGDLFDQEHHLLQRFGADIIVNATGLAGSELAGDKSCYPIRGGLIRVLNDGKSFPKVEAALTITADAASVEEIVFIVPRNDNILLIGGIAESHKDTLELSLESPIIKRMRARCEAFLPALKNAKVDPEYPFAQGLRPFRQQNVRVERELRYRPSGQPRSRIVHTYGQGGAGWSLGFGCAADVAGLVEEALAGISPTPMQTEVRSFYA